MSRTISWLVTSAPELIATLDRAGRCVLGLVWAPALAALAVWRIVRSSSAARLLAAPVLLAAAAYLGLVAAAYAHSLDRGFLSNDSVDQRPLARAGGRARQRSRSASRWAWVRGAAGARRASRGSSSSSATRPRPAGCATRSPRALGDPALELAYPLGDGAARRRARPPGRAAARRTAAR